ncbi:hypothetical protein BpHYR1_049856 [Brachionus plicatilis]|uniref:Uncharacterized protein n=1 Tax=Brachionus plicatilis TaxID=10195 RepID=A0A3M7PF24_BRAPC|nr:hypothetical protein BpHYR1_049856 [Brachionus plicatilis]
MRWTIKIDTTNFQ